MKFFRTGITTNQSLDTNMNYEDILNAKFDHLEWTISDPDDYSSITWGDKVVEKEHLDLLIADNDRSNVELFKEKRRSAYPSIGDQLDKIYHEGVDAWKAEIQLIKDSIPKPE